jgi:hypothetical protein
MRVVLVLFLLTGAGLGAKRKSHRIPSPELDSGIRAQCEDSERDCMGVCFGTMRLDACGTCGGNNESCWGCDHVPNSGKVVDCFGICGGTARRDCDGTCGGQAILDSQGTCCSRMRVDDCGICYGSNACADCNGDIDGEATIDDCGVCSGGRTGKTPNADKDCAGACFGSARPDDCNVCSGGVSGHQRNSDKDCEGVCFGSSSPDACGVCNGDGSTCKGCDGEINSGKVLDACGICAGDNSTCCGPYGACNNVGRCNTVEKGCLCELGWTGRMCTTRQNFCRWQNCGDHGACNEETGRCVCEQGFMGPSCEYSMCSGHGTPDKNIPGKCNCLEGYGGYDCSQCTTPVDKHMAYVCLIKDGESITNRVVDQEATKQTGGESPVYRPIRFAMIEAHVDEIEAIIGGWDALTRRKDQLAILPGSMYNGTIYGCNCLPAIPYEDVYHIFSGGFDEQERGVSDENQTPVTEKGKRIDIQDIDSMPAVERLHLTDQLRISSRFVSHSYVRALTAMEASEFLNEIFEFFGITEDALTGTPATVGKAVDEVKQVSREERFFALVYYTIIVSLVLTVTLVSLVVMFFFTGGRISRATAAGAYAAEEEFFYAKNRRH